ncbi:putative toxin-antitoxin system toxin component, PIN family [Pseudothauera nasutitermitis]|uniref:Putative toxin-antitoxin system toxin component, PIN family n=1 Tax=Pseudothauera nasutitermitis TaxID=2565930 RepID=A0A4S4AXH4_9RHOO|nr:putative toxin-antitoxin system toxin component, PIN family [Pseudothauera nasutitermitis]THF64795.1 putative toxin-antitoxin system toxin component, PIN family [Pseudothauera nasutitermitis]
MRRGVLDTNVVLSALLFTAGRLAWIRHAWQRHQLQPLVCKETVSELLRVLAYPKFKLSASEQEELLADFLPYADVVELPAPWPALPACRDEKDQVFLVLAHIGKADALITGDADILAMREAFPGLILTAEELAAQQNDRDS